MIFHSNMGGKNYKIEIKKQEDEYLVKIDGNSYRVDSRKIGEGELSLNIKGKVFDIMINGNSRNHDVLVGPFNYHIELMSSLTVSASSQTESSHILGKAAVTTPMPGKVIKILKGPNDPVKEGEGVIVVEAMKMENELKSPKNGKISEIRVSQGKAVESGEVLMVIE
jgi:biotin carboxyl carrier protein